jgi:hypothetical protein
MTPREWCLLEEGAAERIEFQDRRIAKWLSPLLSATAGQVITPAQLLGKPEPEDTENKAASSPREAERKYKSMMRKIAKAAKKGK